VKLRHAVVAAVLLLAVLAAFGRSLGHDFVFDDFVLIVDNPGIRGLDAARLGWMLTTTYMTAYMPLGWLAYATAYTLGGPGPFVFHAANLAAHWLVSLALFFTARRLLRLSGNAKPDVPAFAAALLFCVHPLQVNTVVWASALPVILAALFFLLAVLVYLGGVSRVRFAAVFALFLASVLLRWQSLCLPVVLAGLDYWPLRRLRARAGDVFDRQRAAVWAEKLPFVLLSALTASMIMLAKGQEMYQPSLAPVAAARALWLYPWALIRLGGYRVAYGLHDGSDFLGLPGWVALGLAAAAIAWLWRARRSRSAFLLAGACYAAAVLPSSLSAQNAAVYVYLVHGYLSCLGLFILAGSAVRGRRGLVVAVALCAVLAAAARRESRHWSDPVSFWSRALVVAPAFSPASGQLGAALLARGRYAEALPHLAARLDDAPGDDLAAAGLAALGRAAPELKTEVERHLARRSGISEIAPVPGRSRSGPD
jgi:hypothetical protein